MLNALKLIFLMLGILLNLQAQIKPITSSAGQKYPMPEFNSNRSRDTVYIKEIVTLSHSLLNKEYKKPNSLYKDSTILRLYNYLAAVYRSTGSDSSLFYGLKTSEYARTHKNIEFEVKGLFQQALYFSLLKNNYLETIRLNIQAYNIVANADHDPQVFWRICYNLGESYLRIKEFDNSLRYLKQSEELIKSGTGLSTISTTSYKVTILQLMAGVYNHQKKYTLAEECFLKAIEQVNKIPAKGTQAAIFNDYSSFLFEQNRVQEAILQASQALKLWQEIKEVKKAGFVKSNLALFNAELNNVKLAEEYALEVINEPMAPASALKNAYLVLFMANKNRGNWQAALRYYEIQNSIRDSLEVIKNNEELYKLQSRLEIDLLAAKALADKKMRDQELLQVKHASEIQRLRADINTQNYLNQLSNEKQKRQSETQLLREVAAVKASEQEKIIKSLKINELEQNKILERRTRRVLIAGLIFTFMGGVALAGYNRRLRQRNNDLKEKSKIIAEVTRKMAETEIIALRSQMNPHFIFNCLNSIKLYTLENDPKSASEYLTKFAKLIRMVLENSGMQKIPLEQEVETLKLYMDMEEMRFKGKITCDVNVDASLNITFIEIPPLLLQPYVENAIWHGLMQKEEDGKIWINISPLGVDYILIEIVDNGVGRDKSAEFKSKSATVKKSYGMKVTNERIELINHLYSSEICINVTDLNDHNGKPRGTQVTLKIPI